MPEVKNTAPISQLGDAHFPSSIPTPVHFAARPKKRGSIPPAKPEMDYQHAINFAISGQVGLSAVVGVESRS
jgi:hypothetical protein